jgi:hypothetical protein
MTHFDKPDSSEYGPHDKQYLDELPNDGELVKHLEAGLASTVAFFHSIPQDKLTWRYAEGKWTVKEILSHIIDTERIYAYRLLRFSRNDSTELPGFEQDDYVKYSHANERSLEEMLLEFTAVRMSSVTLMKSLDPDVLGRAGKASGRRLTVRATAYILAGHAMHHVNIIKERYL